MQKNSSSKASTGKGEQHLAECKGLIAWAESDESDIKLDVLSYMERMFPQYSYQNRILIALSWLKRGNAITDLHDVAGFHAWTDMGCSVKKGAKAIWILAPSVGRKDKEDPESEQIVFGFHATCVFAYSREDGVSDVQVDDAAKWATASAKRDANRDATYTQKDAEKKQQQQHYPKAVREAMMVLGIETLDGATVKAGYREAALKAHPDKGGSEVAMKAVNNAKDTLITYLDGAKSKAA